MLIPILYLKGVSFLGVVGLDWQFAGIAPIHAPGASDLVLRNANTGAFEVYDIANNQLTGAAPLGSVGLDWQLGGFAVDPPTGFTGSSDGSVSQLVQAMAGFTGSSGTGESLNTAPLSAETSQQPLLTTPQHAWWRPKDDGTSVVQFRTVATKGDDHREARVMPVYTFTTLDDASATGGSLAGTFARGINFSGQIVGYF